PHYYNTVRLSKVVTTLLYDLCSINNVVSNNQMGTRKGCQGAKQQALLNKAVNQANDNRLYTSWIDVKKAYDSVSHQYAMDVLEKLEVPTNIVKFVRRALTTQRTNLMCNKKEIGNVKIEKGILQGDALSPLLFVILMEPLSRHLNRSCEKIKVEEIERNHLIFIDDIK